MGVLSTKWLTYSLFFAGFAWRADACMLVLFCGSGVAALAAKTLKRLLQERRPAGATHADPGMPSSHTTMLFYLASFIARRSWGTQPNVVVAALAAAGLLSAQRVWSRQHTIPQVLAGSVLGSGLGITWHDWHSVWKVGSATEALLGRWGMRSLALGCAAAGFAFLGPLTSMEKASWRRHGTAESGNATSR
eukprot:NODE_17441_length_942_cov_3.350920.p1 GENE.NODE_17441_length_942_cov_3.350920~~NODE_17441_length_942_cov_3.350920.p1  ORF type:complete len:214 (-),score=63.09 NODE_17441_length_942_cov_3.350920:299-871(-)